MKLLLLYIKGNKHQALLTARRYGITLFDIRDTDSRHPITIAYSVPEMEEPIRCWFQEKAIIHPDLGHAVGSLLAMQTVEKPNNQVLLAPQEDQEVE